MADNFTGVEYHTTMESLKTSQSHLVDQSKCKNKPVLKLTQHNDKTFKIMLTLVRKYSSCLFLAHLREMFRISYNEQQFKSHKMFLSTVRLMTHCT